VFPEEDKHSISVDQIRAIGEVLALKAYAGGAKVVIIEPADAMTVQAANSLLKTLEEPAADTFLLLVSHRPERLPATVRSRCQQLAVAPPASGELAAWLGNPEPAELNDLALLAAGAPVAMAELAATDNWNIVKELDDDLLSVCQDKADPQTVAEAWIKRGLERVLVWLSGRIADAIRARAGARGTNPVTDTRTATLHNAWRNLTLAKLIDQHGRAERLLNQLGSGLNLELALRVVLIDFRTHRG
jgi:DNA polymerase-3 subunit delta'